MKLLVSGATRTVRDLGHPAVGRLVVPGAGQRPDDTLPYAFDNGGFHGVDVRAFLRMLDRWALRTLRRPLFVTVPDVVGDASATWDAFRRWAPELRRYGWPLAYVLQDGYQRLPDCEAIFIGGLAPGFKSSPRVETTVAYARARGQWVHMGRCNTRRRLRHALRIGCQSIDGSGWSKWSAIRLPLALAWMDEWQTQRRLFV